MKKKMVFCFAFALLSVFSFVAASNVDANIEVNIDKGWSLLAGFMSPSQINEDSDIKAKNIKVIYALSSETQEYVIVYSTSGKGVDESFEPDASDGFWVYSNKKGSLIAFYRVEFYWYY